MGVNLLHVAQIACTGPAEFIISGVWQGVLLAALAWLALEAAPKLTSRLAHRFSPSTRFTLWMAVFLVAALLPVFSLFRTMDPSGYAHSLLPASSLSATWAVLLAALWMAASALAIARLIWHVVRLLRISRSSRPLPEESLLPEIQAILAYAGKRSVRLCLSGDVDMPMVVGFFRPAVIFPEWMWPRLTPPELRQIVLHEIAHLKRKDDWSNLLQKLLCAFFPLNPALRWAERELCWQREMACDDAVLDASVTPREYAICLTSLAEKRLLKRAEALAPGAWRRRSEVAERVHRILKQNRSLQSPLARPVMAGFLVAFLCAGGMLARAPQLVTFSAVKQASAPIDEARDGAVHRTAVDDARITRAVFREETHPRLVEAIAHAAPLPRHNGKPKIRPALLRRRRSGLSHAQVLPAGWANARSGQADLNRSRIVQTVFFSAGQFGVVQIGADQLRIALIEVAPGPSVLPNSKPSSPQPATVRSQAGWIILQL